MSEGTIWINDIDLSDGQYGVTVDDHTISWFGSPRYESADFSARHGATVYGGYQPARRMPVRLAVVGDTVGDLRNKLDSLKSLLNTRVPVPVRFGYQPDREYYALIDSGIESRIEGGCAVVCDVSLLVPDGVAYSTLTYFQTFTIICDPMPIGIPTPNYIFLPSHPVGTPPAIGYAGQPASSETGSSVSVVAGTETALPNYTITNSGGATSQVSVENVTTGYTLTITKSVPTGAQIRIDCEREYVEYRSSPTAEWSSCLSSITGSCSQFPYLQNGVNNSLLVSGISAGEIEYEYKARYI